MSISAISGLSGFGGSYQVSSINGNPYSLQAVQRIDADEENQRGRALVIGQKKPEDDLYVKDYGELENTKSTATGSFADLLSMQESSAWEDEDMTEAVSSAEAVGSAGASGYASYLNDTIGMMGFQNGLREQLTGVGYTPFA